MASVVKRSLSFPADVAVEATDATVCEGALRRRDAVVTSKRSHLETLAAGVARRLDIIDV